MSPRVRAGSGLATDRSARAAGLAAATSARDALGGRAADLAVVFAAGEHIEDAKGLIDGVREALDPGVLIGCGAGGVLAGGGTMAGPREVERGTATAVWAASLGGGTATPFVVHVEQVEDGVVVEGLPDLEGAAAALLLADPVAFPTEPILEDLPQRAPGVPVLGGLASARLRTGESALLYGDGLAAGAAAVGVRLDGVEVLPCVSQGAAPIGPELTVTSSEGNVIRELAGEPALLCVRRVIGELPPDERAMVRDGVLVGLVLQPSQPEYVQGDFLVRGILGGDPDDGSIAVGAPVDDGQVLRLHVRDADSADRDLRDALGLRRLALGGDAAAGALVFTCNGRGRAMFGEADHDARALDEELGGPPLAGFFAAGEIGPVGGSTFLHGFTATAAIFT